MGEVNGGSQGVRGSILYCLRGVRKQQTEHLHCCLVDGIEIPRACQRHGWMTCEVSLQSLASTTHFGLIFSTPCCLSSDSFVVTQRILTANLSRIHRAPHHQARHFLESCYYLCTYSFGSSLRMYSSVSALSKPRSSRSSQP